MAKFPASILVTAQRMKPAEAVKYFERKGMKITWDWRETLDEANNLTFQVAKSINMEVLQTIRDDVNKAISEGVTFADYKKNLQPRLMALGWWGKQEIAGKMVQLGSPWRLKTIYRTNLQSGYMAGRWKAQEENKKNRPVLEYVAIEDDVTTPICQALNGVRKPVDDPFWNTNYPPNHFNCRSRVRALTEEQSEKRGGVTTKKLEMKDEKTNKMVPAKPAKGFNHNPGKAPYKAETKGIDPDIKKLGEKLKP